MTVFTMKPWSLKANYCCRFSRILPKVLDFYTRLPHKSSMATSRLRMSSLTANFAPRLLILVCRRRNELGQRAPRTGWPPNVSVASRRTRLPQMFILLALYCTRCTRARIRTKGKTTKKSSSSSPTPTSTKDRLCQRVALRRSKLSCVIVLFTFHRTDQHLKSLISALEGWMLLPSSLVNCIFPSKPRRIENWSAPIISCLMCSPSTLPRPCAMGAR